MPTRQEMNSLAQEIIGSYEARVEGVAQIRKATHEKLGEFHEAHNAMARQQRQGLAKVHADLNRAETRRKAGVHSWMEDVASTHQAMAQELRADLSKGRADLGASVSAQLQKLDRAHQAMAQQQRADLSRGHADLRASVSAQLQELDRAHQAMAQQQRSDLSKGHADLRASVGTQLQELDRDHRAMAGQQRETLAKVHSNLSLAERQRRSEVKTWMEEVAAVHAAGREEWQNLARTMQARRAGIAVAEAPPAVAPAPPDAPVEVAEEVEVGEVTEELAFLSTRVFAYLANHPDGTRLTELEREFGLGRFQASRVVKHLMNDGKAKKQGLLYFAT